LFHFKEVGPGLRVYIETSTPYVAPIANQIDKKAIGTEGGAENCLSCVQQQLSSSSDAKQGLDRS
jgi:hypothetical protein